MRKAERSGSKQGHLQPRLYSQPRLLSTQFKLKMAYSVTLYYCHVVHVDFLHRLILSMETNIKSVNHVVAEVELLYTCCSVSLYLNWSLAWATNQEIPT